MSSGRIERFENLIAWQKARALTRLVYQTTQSDVFARDHGLAGQIQRAAVSIMSNIAEGYERDSPTEFHRFLCIAKASCAEVRSQLYVAFDIGYMNSSQFEHLLTQTEELGRIIGGLRASVEKRKNQQR
jgi:four helix bundle protein